MTTMLASTSHPSNTLPRILAVWTRPMTQHELATAAGVSQAGVSRHMKALLTSRPRRAHVVDWTQRVHRFGPPKAIYAPGPGKDKPCDIQPLSQSEISRNYRVRRDQRKPRRDPLTAAFFGAPA